MAEGEEEENDSTFFSGSFSEVLEEFAEDCVRGTSGVEQAHALCVFDGVDQHAMGDTGNEDWNTGRIGEQGNRFPVRFTG